MIQKNALYPMLGLFVVAISLYACSKNDSGANTTPPATDSCLLKTITVTANATQTSQPCIPSGEITVSATGSTGFTFKLDAGSYLNTTKFSNVSAGSHIVTAKDAAGCISTTNVTVNTATTAGPLFTAVKNIVSSNCLSCHGSASSPSGGMYLGTDCAIVNNSTVIKLRTVDGPNFMPQGGQLSASDKAAISNWILAGGSFSN